MLEEAAGARDQFAAGEINEAQLQARQAVEQEVAAEDEIVDENAPVTDACTNFAQASAAAVAQDQQVVPQAPASNQPGAPGQTPGTRAVNVFSDDFTP